MRKGISPLVAAVLLIAATMSIAGILAYWASGYVSTTLETSAKNETAIQCQFADFKIYNCKYNSSTLKLNLILENTRSLELSDLRVYVEYSDTNISLPISLNETLPVGALKTFPALTITRNFSKILIKTQCPDLSITRMWEGCK